VLRVAITDPERYACEPKVDGVRGLVVYQPDGLIETRNRRGERRDWLRRDAFERWLRRLANRLPILWHGTVLDGELIAGRFGGTMAALYGSKVHGERLPFVVFDVPVLAGVVLRALPWQQRRARLELLAQAFDVPFELSPVVEPSRGLVEAMQEGRLEGIVLKDRTSPYHDGSRADLAKVKDRS
jgi:bifunctional non-homologous end joining protein LigD